VTPTAIARYVAGPKGSMLQPLGFNNSVFAYAPNVDIKRVSFATTGGGLVFTRLFSIQKGSEAAMADWVIGIATDLTREQLAQTNSRRDAIAARWSRVPQPLIELLITYRLLGININESKMTSAPGATSAFATMSDMDIISNLAEAGAFRNVTPRKGRGRGKGRGIANDAQRAGVKGDQMRAWLRTGKCWDGGDNFVPNKSMPTPIGFACLFNLFEMEEASEADALSWCTLLHILVEVNADYFNAQQPTTLAEVCAVYMLMHNGGFERKTLHYMRLMDPMGGWSHTQGRVKIKETLRKISIISSKWLRRNKEFDKEYPGIDTFL
jgi:hypothetical protein